MASLRGLFLALAASLTAAWLIGHQNWAAVGLLLLFGRVLCQRDRRTTWLTVGVIVISARHKRSRLATLRGN